MVDSKKYLAFLKQKKEMFLVLFQKVLEKLLPFYKQNFENIKNKLDSNKELKQRVTFGVIFASVLLFVLLCGGIVYIATIIVVCCIMIYELLKMAGNIEQSNNSMFIKLRSFGLFYIAICCISLVLIRETSQGIRISIWMFLTVWAVDSFAYFFGKKFGKIKLAPEISPGKTYEGAILGSIGGLFVSIIIYKLFTTHTNNGFSMVSFIIFSLIVIIVAQLSDLSESFIKRQCNVKDSGNVLPGHGGLMDRFDSLLLVAPLICIIVWLNGGFLF